MKKCLFSFELFNRVFGLYVRKDSKVRRTSNDLGVQSFQVGVLMLLIIKG